MTRRINLARRRRGGPARRAGARARAGSMERVRECLESLDLDDRLRVRLFSWLGGGLLGLALPPVQ